MFVSFFAQKMLNEGKIHELQSLSLFDLLNADLIETLRYALTQWNLSEDLTTLRDPISQEFVQKPCVTSTGHIFSESSLINLIRAANNQQRQPRCPITQSAMLGIGQQKTFYVFLPKLDAILCGLYFLLLRQQTQTEKRLEVGSLRIIATQDTMQLMVKFVSDFEKYKNITSSLFSFFLPNAEINLAWQKYRSAQPNQFTRCWKILDDTLTLHFFFPLFDSYYLNQLVRLCAQPLNMPMAMLDIPLSRSYSLMNLRQGQYECLLDETIATFPDLLESMRRFLIFTERTAKELRFLLVDEVKECGEDFSSLMARSKPRFLSIEDSHVKKAKNQHPFYLNTNSEQEKKEIEKSHTESLQAAFDALVKGRRQEVYLNILLLKYALPNKAYIGVALDLLCQVNPTIKQAEKHFSMFITLSSFSITIANVNTIFQDLPDAWREDFFVWQQINTKQAFCDDAIGDVFLKSWWLTCDAFRLLQTEKHDKAVIQRLCYEAIQLNPNNINATVCYFYLLLGQNPSFKRAEDFLLEKIYFFLDEPVIRLYLQALLVKYVYLTESLEPEGNHSKIAQYGFDILDPYLQSERSKWVHLVKGKDKGKATWCYIRLYPSQEQHYLHSLTTSTTVSLHQFGVVLYSAYGEHPPQSVIRRIQREYFIGNSPTLMPRLLMSLIEKKYQETRIARENDLVDEYARFSSVHHDQTSLHDFLYSDVPVISWSLRLKIAYDIIHALRFLHDRGYAHANLNSSNVVLDDQYHATLIGFRVDQGQDQAMSQPHDILQLGFILFELSSRFSACHEFKNPPLECEVDHPNFYQLIKSCYWSEKTRPDIHAIEQSLCFQAFRSQKMVR